MWELVPDFLWKSLPGWVAAFVVLFRWIQSWVSFPKLDVRVDKGYRYELPSYSDGKKDKSFKLVIENYGSQDLKDVQWWLESGGKVSEKTKLGVLKSGQSVLVLEGNWEKNLYEEIPRFFIYRADFHLGDFCENWEQKNFPKSFRVVVKARGWRKFVSELYDGNSFKA